MRIGVDIDEIMYEAQKPKRTRRKGPKHETPAVYISAYSTMGCSLQGGQYHVRAKDPGAVFATRMKEAIRDGKLRQEGVATANRAVIFSGDSAKTSIWGRVTFGATYMSDDQIMDLPDMQSGKGSLSWIQKEIEKERVENSLNTMMSRLKMLLGMVGEVQELDNPGFQWAYKPKKFFKIKGYTLALMEGRDE